MELKIEIFYGFISTMRYTNLMAVSSLDLLSLSLHADPARYCLSKSHILNIRLRPLRRPEKPNNDAIFCRINNRFGIDHEPVAVQTKDRIIGRMSESYFLYFLL